MNIKRTLRIPKLLFVAVIFLGRNLKATICMHKIPKAIYKNIEFIPCTKQHVSSINKLYMDYNCGKPLGMAKKALLRLAGDKLCVVSREITTQKLIGMSLYYFNKRDIKESTVHEGYTLVIPSFCGKGIGTAQRLHGLQHFSENSQLRGMTSRISLNNISSLKSNFNLGFKKIERYYDSNLQEERYYLFCDLDIYRK